MALLFILMAQPLRIEYEKRRRAAEQGRLFQRVRIPPRRDSHRVASIRANFPNTNKLEKNKKKICWEYIQYQVEGGYIAVTNMYSIPYH